MTDLETVPETVPDTDRDELAGVKLPAAESRLGATLLALYLYTGEREPIGVPVQELTQLVGTPRTSTASNCQVLRGRGLVSNLAANDNRGGRYSLTNYGVAAVWRLYGTRPEEGLLERLVRRLGPVRHRPRRIVAPAEPSGA